jgi:hypothetical protein
VNYLQDMVQDQIGCATQSDHSCGKNSNDDLKQNRRLNSRRILRGIGDEGTLEHSEIVVERHGAHADGEDDSPPTPK